MNKVHARTNSILNVSSGYCPGCLHGVAHNLIGEIFDELNIREKAVAVLPVGCSTLGALYWNVDNIASAHGRAPAVATGLKRCNPDNFVYTYQGDGDLAAIGLSEIMHAANRGENLTTFFVNNSIYGMTGGQMAPTTLVGQKATTSPKGRDPETAGFPMMMCEIISQLKAPVYVARFSLDTPQNIMKAKKGIRRAILNQIEGIGYSFVELLSNCPTNWGMSPLDSITWMQENTIPQFPLGEFKNLVDGGVNDGK